MSDFNRPSSTVYPEPTKRRSSGSRFGDLGSKLARTFGGSDRSETRYDGVQEGYDHTPDEEPVYEEDLEYSAVADTEAWSAQTTPFPVSRNGYEPAAVERRIEELERELAQLRGGRSAEQAVAAEIERIGEQTSSILLVAHERAQEITRQAQEQADRCLADAAANAVQMTASAKRKLSDLDTETDSVWQERARLLEDARNVATALFTLVEEAEERFPDEGSAGSASTGSVHPGSPHRGSAPTAPPRPVSVAAASAVAGRPPFTPAPGSSAPVNAAPFQAPGNAAPSPSAESVDAAEGQAGEH